jgi:hypothetical protein
MKDQLEYLRLNDFVDRVKTYMTSKDCYCYKVNIVTTPLDRNLYELSISFTSFDTYMKVRFSHIFSDSAITEAYDKLHSLVSELDVEIEK